MHDNELYLVVLPLVHLGPVNSGLAEQVITLLPERSFATVFTRDEVERFVTTFKRGAHQYLQGGRVVGYSFTVEPVEGDRVLVKVVQNVTE